ncbi:IS110 family transposase [Neolewinella sp.]|uniref:IS110 family transposase n=1 Tax=Neolewinella sp. TaxID=2993543 RepID=UPI003B52774C
MAKGSKFDKLPIVHPAAAGIDVGSRFHLVSTGQAAEQTRQFGVFTADLHQLASWLVEQGVQTVALESTGSYWQILFSILQDYGLNPILVSGRMTKNIMGRKSDVQDSQWIQRLHALGLLSGSFLPDNRTDSLKQYVRHRQKLQDTGNDYVRKLQKALRLMNIRLDNVLKDVVGQSGTRIIEAILAGERDGERLADLMDWRVKAQRASVVKALSGDWRESYLFELRQSYELYGYLQQQIAQCDEQVEALLARTMLALPAERQQEVAAFASAKKKRLNKNAPQFAIERMAYGVFGTDLSAIDGVSKSTLLVLLSELGDNFTQFSTSGAFASWLGLVPNNKVSGGKVLSKRTQRRSNQVSTALKRVANVIGNLKEGGLNQFFRRLAYKKGRVFAITATARKVAVIIWNMVTKKEPFNYLTDEHYLAKVRQAKILTIRRQMERHALSAADLFAS